MGWQKPREGLVLVLRPRKFSEIPFFWNLALYNETVLLLPFFHVIRSGPLTTEKSHIFHHRHPPWSAAFDFRRKAARGWTYSCWLQHPEGEHSSLGSPSSWRKPVGYHHYFLSDLLNSVNSGIQIVFHQSENTVHSSGLARSKGSVWLPKESLKILKHFFFCFVEYFCICWSLLDTKLLFVSIPLTLIQ